MQRVKELDSIRGLAALSVVIHHLWFPAVGTVGGFGHGVDLLFVLSGYLITTIILDNALTEGFLFSFYARRFLRIWPAYYLALGIVVLTNGLLPTPGNLEDLPFFLTYTQVVGHCWIGRELTFPVAFCHTWSLAIQEQFYIFWPVVIWLVGRRGLPALALATVGLAVAARAWGINHSILITRCDALALGGLLAGLIGDRTSAQQMSAHSRNRFTILSLAAPGVVFVLLSCTRLLNARWPGLAPAGSAVSLKLLAENLILVATVGMIVLYSGHPALRWLRNPLLVYLGTISYGIYMYHHIIFKLWDNCAASYGWRENFGIDLFKLGLSIALAILSWHLVERPILALKRWLRYQPKAKRPSVEIASQGTAFSGVKVG